MGGSEEFIRRQTEAASMIVSAYRDLTKERARFRDAMVRGILDARSRPTQRDREVAAASVLASDFQRHEEAIHDAAREVLAGAAAASENWQRHSHLLTSVSPSSTQTVAGAIRAWKELRSASGDAQASEDVFRETLSEFASLGPTASAAVSGTLAATEGMRSATSELVALADEYLATLQAVWREP